MRPIVTFPILVVASFIGAGTIAQGAPSATQICVRLRSSGAAKLSLSDPNLAIAKSAERS